MSTAPTPSPPSSSSSSSSSSSKRPRPHRPRRNRGRSKFLLLGDSVTQLAHSAENAGWAAHLADAYQRRADVLNRGKSGFNTDWYLRFLSTEDGYADVFGDCVVNVDGGNNCGGNDDAHSDVRLVTVFFGANDASSPDLNARQHVPLPTFRSNLRSIVSVVRDAAGSAVRIVVVAPPPVHHRGRLEFQKRRYGEKATGKLERTLELSGRYAAAAAEVAGELGIPCLNLWRDMQDARPPTKADVNSGEGDGGGEKDNDDEPWAVYLSDGLHLSREGNIFVGRRLVEVINREFPELAVTPCPHTGYTGNSSSKCPGLDKVGPWHDEIDHRDVGKAFEGLGGERKKRRREEEEG